MKCSDAHNGNSTNITWYCWYSEMRSFILLSASVNSISSIPSPVYQWRNALRRNMAEIPRNTMRVITLETHAYKTPKFPRSECNVALATKWRKIESDYLRIQSQKFAFRMTSPPVQILNKKIYLRCKLYNMRTNRVIKCVFRHPTNATRLKANGSA